MTEAFEYVVQRKRKQRIAFGTTKERDVSPLHSKFNRISAIHTPELFPNLSPLSYFIEKKRGAQRGGYWSRVARFKRVTSEGPSPTAYSCQQFPYPINKSKAPFNSKTPRDARFLRRDFTPGPGTYHPRVEFMHNLKYYQNFGRNRVKVNVPDEIEDLHRKCGMCLKSPTENGEPFWKNIIKDNGIAKIICCNCMKNLQKEALTELKKKAIMKTYRLVCECPYYIRHTGIHNCRVIASHTKDGELPKEARFDKFLHTAKEEGKDE